MGKIEFKTWNETQYKENHLHCKYFPYLKITLLQLLVTSSPALYLVHDSQPIT